MDPSSGLDVRFDDPSAGFFVRQRPVTSGSGSSSSSVVDLTSSAMNDDSKSNDDNKEKEERDAVVHSARFTVLRREKPASIVAQYGPFKASQTAPMGAGGELNHGVSVSAHLVTKEVPTYILLV